jgi:hypothetical protein
MTVEQLIEFLKTCPQDAAVEILVERNRGYETWTAFEDATQDDIDAFTVGNGNKARSYVQLGRR